jgi:outer membrane receptor for ferrienterochelin and colicins
MTKIKILMALLILSGHMGLSQSQIPTVTVEGKIICERCPEKPVSFASVAVKGLPFGTASDTEGNFRLELPVGRHTLKVSAIGFISQEQILTIKNGSNPSVVFNLHEDNINLENVVVTATRYELDRREAPLVVNVINDHIFEATQSVSLSEGLNFQPGLRLENNCQNCGFNQLRMNGLQGSYTQVLVNSRPIFSALQGVYGLEMIPANMIERVEIARGGGSALYGGNAIAGTVNIITKDPVMNTFQFGSSMAFIERGTSDHLLNGNISTVNDDLKSGFNLYVMHRNRNPFDANGDGFSEITKMENSTFGGKAYLKPNDFSKITFDFHGINEFRRGGNLFHLPPHHTDLTEQTEHRIFGGGLAYELYNSTLTNKISFYSSLQSSRRKSYYGSGGNIENFDPEEYFTGENGNFVSPYDYLLNKLKREPTAYEIELAIEHAKLDQADIASRYYGNTNDLAWVGGVQFSKNMLRSTFITGLEVQHNDVLDQAPGYDRTIDQQTNNAGAYAQYEYDVTARLKLLAGIRYDYNYIKGNYLLFDYSNTTDLRINALNPRLNVLYKPTPDIQIRSGYARGFRTPQAYDEDLHIETVGGSAKFIRLSRDLDNETSDAFTASIDYTGKLAGSHYNLLLEGFYTRLRNPFVNVGILEGSENVPHIFEKQNSEEDAIVAGTNVEFRYAPSPLWSVQLGGTVQAARYNEPIEVYGEEEAEGQKIMDHRILRTPNVYGYFITTTRPLKNFRVNFNGTFTGSMPQPYESGLQKPIGIYNTSAFFEMGVRTCYEIKVMKDMKMQINVGVQNIFNSYQKDFDTGIDRDAGYVYGPTRPRTYVFGIKLGN